MAEAHRRKKNPDQVRLALLEGAASIAMERGLAAVSVQAVSDAAGVTKGGFFHHFPCKQALLDGMMAWLLDALDSRIDAAINFDPEPHGCFTRAYVGSVFQPKISGDRWATLWMSTLTDPQLSMKWAEWYQARLERHRATDTGADLEAVRLTVGGIWLAGTAGVPIQFPEEHCRRLIAATYQ
ncbi:TetR/AcrR family transcriptional regulator (plasmid) [Rhizobium sp. B230/85]|uniref:TetR/AcrR family transcriptional regulator n=1 Tax=unclassified Rhizobium TaxID=2613769 RepID=UPI001ADB8A52|nr:MULTISPECIES: TetR/AcrR family transcriptional regulator [unclassified Rhizobium]MBO9134470.1 TetR/AcrR family transcriptional regulator [Rhizobium sp. B209b/85]QXZ99682.1 TetR/AcrR family transcriptional regulator [Rhizobium sp. B230/85]